MLSIGSVWSSVRLKGIESDALTALDQYGNSYLTGEYGPRTYVIECKCGKEVRVPVHEFPGKWNFRYCGGDDCEFSPEALRAKRKLQNKVSRGPVGRPPSLDPCANITISMPLSVFNMVNASSASTGKSVSKCIADLVTKGRAWELEHVDD